MKRKIPSYIEHSLLTLLLLFLCGPFANSSDRVQIDIFFESLDRQAWQWYFLTDAVRERLPQADVKISCLFVKDSSGTFKSKHGERELQECLRMAVIDKLYPSRFFNYLNARSLTPYPSGWKDAAIFSGISPQKIEQEIQNKGITLANEHYERSKKLSITNTSVLINGKPYLGKAQLLDLFKAVNSELPEGKRVELPKLQGKSRERLPRFMVVISSVHHIQQDNNIVSFFSKHFDGLKSQVIEYESKNPGKLLDIEFIPAYIIEDTNLVRTNLGEIANSQMFSRKNGFLVYYDKNRKGIFVKRKPEPNTLKIFVMSQCPYGTQAENIIIEGVRKKLISEKINISIHYIANVNTTDDGKLSFRSLHGTPEWEENIRQLIISKKFPEKFFDYLLERNKNFMSSRWELFAQKVNIPPEAIINAFEEGEKLLAEDIKLANALGITASPTFLLNGNVLIVGINELRKVKGFERLPSKPASSGACK